MKIGALFLVMAAGAATTVGVVPPDMGPVGQAITMAREWRTDACVSRVEYSRAPRVENFTYTFFSRSRWKEDLQISHNGSEFKLMEGRKHGGNRCIGRPELDVSAALAIAVRAGFSAGDPFIDITLDSVDKEEIDHHGGGSIVSKEGPFMLSLAHKTYWHVRGKSVSVLIDDATKKVHYKGPVLGLFFVAKVPPY